jgi:histidyl-tRNA synthetase
VFDPSITRGLDYYTGVVFETFLEDLPGIGSICSGGRYNDLASLYTKHVLPGVGASIGLDRLMAALEDLGVTETIASPTVVLVLRLDEELTAHYHQLARTLRKNGIPAEVYPDAKKLGGQFAYAEKKGIPWGIVCGSEEYAASTVQLRNLRTRESVDGLSIADVIEKLS